MRQTAGRSSNLLLAVILMIGAMPAIIAASQLGLALYHQVLPSEDQPTDSISLEFAPDGEVYIEEHRFHADGSPPEITRTKLDGQPFELKRLKSRTGNAPGSLRLNSRLFGWPWSLSWKERLSEVVAASDETWFLIRDELPPHRGYLQGFSLRTRRPLGCLGTAGFGPDIPPPGERFPGDGAGFYQPITLRLHGAAPTSVGSMACFFASEVEVFEADFADRSVRQLDLGGEKVLGIGGGNAVWPQLSWLAIRTDRAIHFFYADGSRHRLPLPAEVARFEALTVAERLDGSYSLIGCNWQDPPAATEEMFVYVGDAAGNFSPRVGVKVTGTSALSSEEYTTEFCGSPVWLALEPLRYGISGQQLASELATLPRQSSFWLTVAAGAVLAGVCFRRQLRYRLPLAERMGWPLFVFLFGIPGWIGYRYCRRWPVLETCGSCRQRVSRVGDVCAACAAEFPLPHPLGTEVFA